MILVQDKGIVVRNHKYSQTTRIVSILGTEHGKWSGFYRKKAPLMLGTFCEFSVTVKNASELGTISIETIQPSDVGKLWQDPVVMAGYAVLCESASRFIPEGMGKPGTFVLLSNMLLELSKENLCRSIQVWENHLLTEYLDRNSVSIVDGLPGLKAHCKRTKALDTKLREDLLALLGLI